MRKIFSDLTYITWQNDSLRKEITIFEELKPKCYMTKINEIYRCQDCGNIVEILNPGEGVLQSCDKPMDLVTENSVDAAVEKHVPVIEKIEGGYKVSVGSVEHPMIEKHYIQWIELITERDVMRHFLKPGEKPVAIFKTDAVSVKAREYCNLHGLWVSEL